MFDSTTAAAQLRSDRTSLGLSQSRLARLSGVSRFKICTYELGDASLTSEEQRQLSDALLAEAKRLGNIAFRLGLQRPVCDRNVLESDPRSVGEPTEDR
jgi:predicted transcriptional regulator